MRSDKYVEMLFDMKIKIAHSISQPPEDINLSLMLGQRTTVATSRVCAVTFYIELAKRN